MRVVITTASSPFRASADRLRASALAAALQASGAEVDVVALPFSPTKLQAVAPQLLAFRLLDLSESMATRIDRLVTLCVPASVIPHPHKILWHGGLPALDSAQPCAGETLVTLDHAGRTAASESRLVLGISRAAATWMAREWQVAASPLYEPPPLACLCRNEPAENYVLALGCYTQARLGLLLAALGQADPTVKVVAVAAHWSPETIARVTQAAPDRVSFVAGPEPERMAALLGATRAVLLAAPHSADTGIALAAMLCARPIIVLTDAGAALEFVDAGQSGLICDPTPDALAAAIDQLWADPARARALGAAAQRRYQELAPSWENVAQCLLASG